jgi:prepilin peptidase CpaA
VFAGPALVWVTRAVLAVLLTTACVWDLRTRRIPNWLVLVTAVTGIAAAVVARPWFDGLLYAGSGLLTGLALWIPLFALGMLGAGDVKLFAAAATYLGVRAAVEGALYTALFGGVMAAGFMVANSGLKLTFFRIGHSAEMPMLLRQDPGSNRHRMPYALAIAAGVLTAIMWPGHLLT